MTPAPTGPLPGARDPSAWPLGPQPGGWVLCSKWGEVKELWKLTLPLATFSGLMTTRTWIPMGHVGEGERTGPQPSEGLLPLAIGGPWVHSANVLSLNPPQAAQWKGCLFPGLGGWGDTWGHSRHLGVQSRRESGQSPLPHSQFPSPGQPAPVDGRAPPLQYPRPGTHRPGGPHPDHGHGLPCVQRSEKRRAEKGTQAPSPEAGAREEVCLDGDPRPYTGQDPCRRPDGAPRPPSAQIQQMHTCHCHGRMCSLVSGEE